MGGSSSKSSVQQTNEFFNKTTNSFVSENSQKVSASALNINSVNFRGSTFKGCRVAIRQAITSDVIASGVMTSQNIQDLTAKLKADATSKIDNEAATKSGFLSPAIGNSSTATTNLKTTVTNIIENTMTSKTVQDIFAKANNQNLADFSGLYYECDPQYKSPGACNADNAAGCDLVVDQNIKASVVAKGVADALTKALASTITESTVTADVKSSAATTNAGLDDLVTSIFKGLTGIWGIIALVVCVAIAAALYFLMSPAGQEASLKLANAGASKIKGPMPF
jgi:hypothetical protein